MSQYTQIIEIVKSSGLFDQEWYLKKYPDVAMLAMDPVEHYFSIGARLGRDPSPNFSTQGYLQAYPDVEQAGYNPLYHYLTLGKNEGRLAPLSRSAWEDRQAKSVEIERPPQVCPAEGKNTEMAVCADAGLERELVGARKKCQELTEQNELLLLQLQQAHEELEEYFLKYQELAGKAKTKN